MSNPRCLLCDAPVDDDEVLRSHLAAEHGLQDDPGTESHLADLEQPFFDPAGGTAAGGGSPLAMGGPAAPPANHVHDPAEDDERWRPVTIGIGGLILLVLAVVAIQLTM